MTLQHSFPDEALEFRFVQASGPGGQHVNKTSTAVELRVNLAALHLSDEVARRLSFQHRRRINKQGELIIRVETYRSQSRNRKEALNRLSEIISIASRSPRKRIPTRPSLKAKRKRVDDKKQRGRTKSQRRKPDMDS